MARLTYANGVKVEVDDDKAKALSSRGYSAEEKKATAKRSSGKSDDK